MAINGVHAKPQRDHSLRNVILDQGGPNPGPGVGAGAARDKPQSSGPWESHVILCICP